jgi:hypothetical protein
MSSHRSRKKRPQRRSIAERLKAPLARVIEHPFRAGFIAALSLTALWLVLTASLPYALAPQNPDAALALNDKNPAALLAKAEALKKKLPAIFGGGGAKAEQKERAADGSADTLSNLPQAQVTSAEAAGEREKVRDEIRELALRTIAIEPLNAQAFRLLAEATAGVERVRLLMQDSFRRSRRESISAFWLLNDSVYRKDFSSAVYYADVLLRTRPELEKYVLGYLFWVADTPEGRPLVIAKLEDGPAWRKPFFGLLPRAVKSVETPMAIMAALRDSKKPVTDVELLSFLQALINTKHVDLAYNAWLQSLPPSQTQNMALLTNADFQKKPSGLPFDWQIGSGANALAEIVPLEGVRNRNVLHIGFGDGRVTFPQVDQVLVLPQGRYRLEGKLRGEITGKRGLRWRLTCLYSAQVLGETDMLLGHTDQWRLFSFEAEIPQTPECAGQTLRLIHDSRSASEEFVSGEVWFNDLSLEHVAVPQTAQWAPVQ